MRDLGDKGEHFHATDLQADLRLTNKSQAIHQVELDSNFTPKCQPEALLLRSNEMAPFQKSLLTEISALSVERTSRDQPTHVHAVATEVGKRKVHFRFVSEDMG